MNAGWTASPSWVTGRAHVGTHRLTIEGEDYEVEVGLRSGGRVDVAVNGKTYRVEIAGSAATPPPAVPAVAAPVAAPSRPATAGPAAPVASGAGGEVRAPISGLVISIAVEPGQHVTTGSVLLVLEAMKMENEIFAPQDGTVRGIAVKPQQEVAQGDLLVTFA